jgi:TolB protein
MLLRAYRITDKSGSAAVKLATAAGTLLADGVLLILGSPQKGTRRGLLGLLALIASALLHVLIVIATALWMVLAFIGGAVYRLFSVATRGTARATGATRSGVQGAMARRAARTEMQATLQEDPLRVQNRVLGLVVVLMLIGLIAVVIWATDPQRSAPPAAAAANPGAFSLVDTAATPEPQATSAALIAPTSIPTATQLPEVLQTRGSIAFTVRENGQSDLWAISVGSRTPIRITNDLADERDPAWAPDGLRLAYASNKDGNWEIYVYDLTTNRTERKTFNLAFDGNPSWSPDSNWLVYETYQGGNLDVYVLPVTDQNATLEPITLDPAADFAPAWSPDGRNIAFTSLRGGVQDIWVVSLDDISAPRNLTATAGRAEDHAAWSPDGRRIAYSALDEGIDKVFVRSLDALDAPPEVIGRGRTPSWAPDGRSIIAAVDTLDATHMTVYPYGDALGLPQIISVPPRASGPVWTGLPLPASLINSGGLPLRAEPLYVEQEFPFANGLYPLGPLVNNVDAPSPQLSDRVNDSFNALRERVLTVSGRDFLSTLGDAFWDLNQRPQPGEDPRNWHYTGRMFAADRNAALVGFPPAVEIVREDRDVNTIWRVFVRVDDGAQSGQLGEPLRALPWDINSRFSGDVEAYDAGGRPRPEVPEGYYVDLTEIARDYGWQPLPAGSDWRLNFNAMNYWAFYKPQGLSWVEAMLEIWTRDQIAGFLPTATPAPVPTTTADTGG